jgi:hypothetical protein
MDYAQRLRLRARLQRCGMPAVLDEIVRLGAAVEQLTALVAGARGQESGGGVPGLRRDGGAGSR